MKKRTKILLTILIFLIVLLSGGWFYLHAQVYHPSKAADKIAQQATTTQPELYFKSKLTTNPEIIFYPGALVEPASYSIWAKRVADAGYPVYIVRFPMDLAVLAPNQAGNVLKNNQRDYVIGGHSLGGVMASRYAHEHQKHLKGVFFLASYPDKKGSLKGTDLPVLSITASRDGVLNRSAYKKAKRLLPKNTAYEQISGGNHAGFGSYGAQKGDNTATISNQAQQRQVAQRLIQWLKNLN
ncbi:carboxymethylenebutenolidase-related protein [Pediococcus damnosus]|uniref:Carboxymethylenebutenolidase-related protein n=1 Tax=Pediococcus damnosus TaxID=51663 RepID=A0A0R2HL14_9LACO|nr:alpha/beta hydrolase [Pediococcus damnosus]AMV63073.1 carboxymethylenebutenolidase-related protein [Pediococcus damnosus]AMV64774.1 carboxymethylenebutenolidase-related protein [Pediococcus damnosus]AMV67037.1 carboxymethylenebutenolidase-related protein [Pediococcus damnosus]AMV69360.1 carboxymethylenebutenolidase-related protein [Pediococcus damnosus]KJU74383.1 carboxymethylenebutenolidase [Pediococcus damnosus LMG 28219]